MSLQTQVNPFFTPTQISGCQLWLDATDVSTLSLSGSNITQWRDKSVNATPINVSTGTPTLSNFNGQSSVFFNGSTRLESLNYTRLAGVSNINWFVVANIVNVNLTFGLLIGTQYTSNFFSQNSLLVDANTLLLNFRRVSGTSRTFVSRALTAGSVIAGSSVNFSTGVYSVSTNGTTTTSSGGPTGTQDSTSVNLYIGNTNYPGEAFITGTISECLLYTSSLTLAQQQQIEGYLAWKWGLQGSLPATHPYKNSPIPPLLSPPVSIPRSIQNLWLPNEIPGLQLWLDAADSSTVVRTGTTVTQWSDKSGNARNASASNIITYSSSNIVFNGTGFFTVNLDFIGGRSHIAFILCSNTNFTNIYGARNGSIGSNSLHVGFRDSVRYRLNTWGNDYEPPPVNYRASSSNILEYIWQNNSNKTIYANGFLEGTQNATGTPGTMAGGGSIGNVVGQGVYQGTIQEMLFYTSVSGIPVTTAQRQQIEGYLAWKWGMQRRLPANHPYFANPVVPVLTVPPIPARMTAASWSPLQISDCQLWFDASDRSGLVLSNDIVTQWNDKSGQGNHTTARTGDSVYRQRAINTLPAVFFANTFFTGPFATPYTGSTVQAFCVATLAPSATAAGRILSLGRPGVNDNDSQTTTLILSRQSNGLGIRIQRNGSALNATLPAYNTPFLGQGGHNGTLEFISANGNLTISSQSTGSTANLNITSYGLGQNTNTGDGSGKYAGFIGEVIYYTRILTTIERQRVEGYLAWKWGIQGNLPNNHPFKKWPPTP